MKNIYVPSNGSHLPIVQVFEFNSLSNLIENLYEIKMIFFMDDLRGLEIVLEFPPKAPSSQEHIHKVSLTDDNMLRILIPKKEFEKGNNSLADLLLHSIRKPFSIVASYESIDYMKPYFLCMNLKATPNFGPICPYCSLLLKRWQTFNELNFSFCCHTAASFCSKRQEKVISFLQFLLKASIFNYTCTLCNDIHSRCVFK